MSKKFNTVAEAVKYLRDSKEQGLCGSFYESRDSNGRFFTVDLYTKEEWNRLLEENLL